MGSGVDPVRQPVDPPADSSAGRADVSENLPSRGDLPRRRPGQSDNRRIRLRRRSAGLAAPPLALGGGMVVFADRRISCDHPRRKREEPGGNDGDLQRFVPFGKPRRDGGGRPVGPLDRPSGHVAALWRPLPDRNLPAPFFPFRNGFRKGGRSKKRKTGPPSARVGKGFSRIVQRFLGGLGLSGDSPLHAERLHSPLRRNGDAYGLHPGRHRLVRNPSGRAMGVGTVPGGANRSLVGRHGGQDPFVCGLAHPFRRGVVGNVDLLGVSAVDGGNPFGSADRNIPHHPLRRPRRG